MLAQDPRPGAPLDPDPGDPPSILPRATPGSLLPRGFGSLDPADLDPAGRAALYGFPDPDASGDDRPALPPDHRHDYLRRHGAIARLDGAPCQACHTERQCLDCHSGALPPEANHPPGFIAFHAIEAARDASACVACHGAQTFCKNCHDGVRVGTRGPAAPVPGLRYHPASWLGAVPGPDHAIAARRDLWSCTSCHTERDCVDCHTNVNPHPPGWAATCRSLIDSNPRACVACHVDTARLRAICR